MEDPKYLELNDELQRLRDEQQRLRDEQEKLRRDKTAGMNGNGAPKDAEREKETGKSSAARDSDQDKNKEAGKGEDKNKQEEEQPKAPLGQRAREFARAHPKGILLGAIGFVAVAILGFFLILYLNSYESTDDAEVDGHLNAMSSRINGTVVKVYTEDNQRVVAGQLLVELDPRDYQTALDQARASYAAAQAQLAGENPNVPITRTANQTTITSGAADV